MRRWLYGDAASCSVSIGLLVLRLVMGAAFVIHGWPKIQKPFAWMGPDAAMPAFLLGLAALAEFGGGIALILGFLTRIASFGLLCTMFVAVTMVHMKAGDAFVSTTGRSYELPAVYFACSILFLIAGPGRFSLDALVFGRAGAGCGARTTPAA